MSDEPDVRRELALDRFWDDLVTGKRPRAANPDLDPIQAEVIRRLRSLDTAPDEDPTFGPRLWEELMQGHAYGGTIPLRPIVPGLNGRGNGHAPTGPRLATRPRREPGRLQTVVSFAVTAALIAAVLAMIVFITYDRNNVAVPPLQETPTPTTENWPMYRGDSGRSGNMPMHGPTGSPAEAWRYQTQGRIDAAPIVVDGVLYVASEDGNLYSLDAKTGAEVWTAQLGAGSGSSPAFADGVIYIGDNSHDLHAIDAATGQELWKGTGLGLTDPGPIVDGVLYAASADGTFQALQASDGEVLWRTTLPQGASRAAGYADGFVFVGSGDGRVNALDAKTGEAKWSYDLGTGTVGTVAVASGVVYGSIFGGAANSFVALDAATGQQLWTFVSPAGGDVRSPAIGDGLVYTVSGDGNVYALDVATGEQRWSAPVGSVARAAPALVGDTLYVVANAGKVFAFDAATGAERWHFDYGSSSDYGPIVVDGLVYLATDGGYVIAIGGEEAVANGSPEASATAPAASGSGTPTSGNATGVPSDPVAFLWQTTGGSIPFADVSQIATGPQGTLYVIDGGNQRIAMFDPDGLYLDDLGAGGSGTGPGQFLQLNGIAVDEQGRVFVADVQRKDVQIFDADGTFLSVWPGGAGAPTLMQVDIQGNLWFADFDGARIQEFAADGTLLATFGGFGDGDGQLIHPNSVAVDAEGNAYVAECDNHRISKFGPDGQFITTWTHDFGCLATILVDDQGHVFVCDSEKFRIQVLNADGTFLAMWGRAGSGEGQFTAPTSLALDGHGNIYVGDIAAKRVQKFRLLPPLAPAAAPSMSSATPQAAGATAPVFAWASTGDGQEKLDTPLDVAVAPDGTVWVADVPGEFKIFDADGHYLETWGSAGSDPGQFLFTGEFGSGVFFAFAPDGSLYVADYGNYRVQHFDRNRQLVGTWGTKGTGDGQFLTTTGIAVVADGTVLVADASRNDIQHFDTNGTFLDRFDAAASPDGPLVLPLGIARDARGRLVVVENGPPARVRVFDAFGAQVAELDISGQQPPSWNNDIDVAVDAAGNIYVCDQNNGLIRVFGPDLTFRYQWGSAGEGDARLHNPGWMALGPDGAVYVTDDANGRLVRFDAAPPASA